MLFKKKLFLTFNKTTQLRDQPAEETHRQTSIYLETQFQKEQD